MSDLNDSVSTSVVIPIPACPTVDTNTRDGIANRIRLNLNDEGVKFYSPSDLNDSIQDGYDEIAAYTGCIEKVTTLSWVANLTYYDFHALIPDFLAVKGIFNGRIKRWMLPGSSREFDGYRIDWEMANNEPQWFYPANWRWIAFFPQPAVSAGVFYPWYAAQADILTGTSIPQIPPDNYTVLEYYVTADLLDQSEEWTKAQHYWKLYLSNLEEFRTDVRSRKLPDKQRILVG